MKCENCNRKMAKGYRVNFWVVCGKCYKILKGDNWLDSVIKIHE